MSEFDPTLRFLGLHAVLEIEDFALQSPLLWVTQRARCPEPSAIYLERRIRKPDDLLGPARFAPDLHRLDFSHWQTDAKWHYLVWHARARPITEHEAFLLLFLAGLERKILFDIEINPAPDEREMGFIFEEIWRLREQISDAQYTFRHRADEVLWMLMGAFPGLVSPLRAEVMAAQITPLSPYTTRPEVQMSTLLLWAAQTLGEITPWLAFHIGRTFPGARSTVAVSRARDELRALFDLRFAQRFERGLSLEVPEARRVSLFTPFNQSLDPTHFSWPDILQKTTFWRRLSDSLGALYNECQDELRPFALAIGRQNVRRTGALAFENLPLSLRAGKTHPARALVEDLGGESLEKNGMWALSADELAGALALPHRARSAFSLDLTRKTAIILHNAGFEVEPTPFLTAKPWPENQQLVLFRANPQNHVQAAPTPWDAARYNTAREAIRLCLAMGETLSEDTGALARFFMARLGTILEWERAHKARLSAILTLSRLEKMPLTEWKSMPFGLVSSREIGDLLLDMSARSGQITAATQSALFVAWKKLKLEKRDLNRKLDALSARGIIVLGFENAPQTGEKIPPSPLLACQHPKVELALDFATIQRLREETASVHFALQNAMNTDPAPPDSSTVQGGLSEEKKAPQAKENGGEEHQVANFTGLAPRYQRFLAIILERKRWKEKEAIELARSLGLMLGAALEDVNDWAIEQGGAAILWEEGGEIVVDGAP